MWGSLKYGGAAVVTVVAVVAGLFVFGGSASASAPKKHKPISFSTTVENCENQCTVVPTGDPNDSFAISSFTASNDTANPVHLKLDPQAINNPNPACVGGVGAFILELTVPAHDTRSIELTQPYIWQNTGPNQNCTTASTLMYAFSGTGLAGVAVTVVGQRLSL